MSHCATATFHEPIPKRSIFVASASENSHCLFRKTSMNSPPTTSSLLVRIFAPIHPRSVCYTSELHLVRVFLRPAQSTQEIANYRPQLVVNCRHGNPDRNWGPGSEFWPRLFSGGASSPLLTSGPDSKPDVAVFWWFFSRQGSKMSSAISKKRKVNGQFTWKFR